MRKLRSACISLVKNRQEGLRGRYGTYTSDLVLSGLSSTANDPSISYVGDDADVPGHLKALYQIR